MADAFRMASNLEEAEIKKYIDCLKMDIKSLKAKGDKAKLDAAEDLLKAARGLLAKATYSMGFLKSVTFENLHFAYKGLYYSLELKDDQLTDKKGIPISFTDEILQEIKSRKETMMRLRKRCDKNTK